VSSTSAPIRRPSIRWPRAGRTAASVRVGHAGAPDPQAVAAGHPGYGTSAAAAIVSYDVPHHAPWGWRVSLYTWTKSLSAGMFGVAVVLALTGQLAWQDDVTRWAAPLGALFFLGVTGVLLIWDLKHPFRFYLIFTRHHWRSWLVRGSFIIGGFGGIAFLYLVAAWSGVHWAQVTAACLGIPLALGTACYTAYLFAQAKARDLWQSPLLPAHLAVQCVLAGSAALLPVAWAWPPRAGVQAIEIVLAAVAAAHVLLVWTEITLPHVTAHAHLAAREMTHGRFALFFRIGVAAVLVAVAAPWIGVVAVPFALIGLLAYEHAYVQAGQSVPLA
jgi:formate-dependent nitrite reductase membrane component NrfD